MRRRIANDEKIMMTKQSQCIHEFGRFRVDAAKRLLVRDGETLPLTPKCFDILLALVERSGEVISKDSLINRVWPDSFVEEGNLTYNTSILRKALGERAGEIAFVFLDDRVSPKRKRIAVIRFEGGPPAMVFDLPQPQGQTVGWTSDSRALTYLDARNGVYNIWAQPLDGGAPRQLTNFTTDQIFAYAWSPDGKLLAGARGNQKSDVILIEAISKFKESLSEE